MELCTPKTLTGFLLSPFITNTPHCTALKWLSYKGSEYISLYWIFLGTWITSLITQF